MTSSFILTLAVSLAVQCDVQGYILGHNLYDYTQFCQAKPFQMQVQADGCESKHIQNNFCYGQCLSQFYPTGWKSGVSGGQMACSVCVPVITHAKRVLLHCPKLKRNYQLKRVQIITKCKCRVSYCKVMDYFHRLNF